MTFRYSKLSSVFLLVGLEFLFLYYFYKVYNPSDVELPPTFCRVLTGSEYVCFFFSNAIPSIYVLILIVVIAAAFFPIKIQNFFDEMKSDRDHRIWILLNIIGVFLVALPMILVQYYYLDLTQKYGILFWLLGMVFMLIGLALWLYEVKKIVSFLFSKAALVFVLLLLIPSFAVSFSDYIWDIDRVRLYTFNSVGILLQLFGFDPTIQSEIYTIGLEGFRISVDGDCTGLSGMGLIALFTIGYIWVRKSALKWPYVLLLVPVGITLSWMLNTVRISLLLWIGAYISPQIAVDAFHSYAGWVMFTLLALGLVVFLEKTTWLRRSNKGSNSTVLPFYQDENAAKILPFVVLMGTSLIIGAATTIPEQLYPIKLLPAIITLLVFSPIYRPLIDEARLMPVSMGILVGSLWIFVLADDDVLPLQEIVENSIWNELVWVTFRVIGTVMIIPIVEELFFRGYVFKKLEGLGLPYATWFALLTSSLLFGIMHGNWWLATIAGLVFGILFMRSGKLYDAVIAHSVANLIIVIWVLINNDWSVI